MGELFQNNHHTFGQSPNFAARWFEIDPTWSVIRVMNAFGMVKLPAHVQKMRYPRTEPAVQVAQVAHAAAQQAVAALAAKANPTVDA
jgi:stearoyl-CoA desaturase (delta-9 desaturase)